MHNLEENSELLKTPEASAFLRMEKATLWDKCRKKEIPHIAYNSRSFRFRKSDLEQWLKERSR